MTPTTETRPTTGANESNGGTTTVGSTSNYLTVRELTEQLARPLSGEDQTAQSMPDVSPTKWHRAHVTWFFETFILERYEPGFEPFDAAYRVLFNSYYETIGEQYPRAARGTITRPGATDVGHYRSAIDARILALLDRLDGHPDRRRIAELVELGLHHEQQHQELLLMDIKHVLSYNPLEPAYREQPAPSTPLCRPIGWVDVEGGLVDIGNDGGGFSFDNESPRHRVHLEPFAIADRLVTAGEWQDFIDDGGYRRPDLWLSDGWHTTRQQGWEAPLYWRRRDDGWWVHTLGGTRPVTDAEPVCHVSHYEADAFARWSGARLPTEFEWEHAVTTSTGTARSFSLDRLHPSAAAPSSEGLDQISGDCWQWTSSAYLAYPRFVPAPGAVGEYNGKFMSGQMVLRGGAAITPPGHTRPSYRNFFPPFARWPMTGVRLANGDPRPCPSP
jgi:ergothioneine biosynthesis protein EgtB